jgi:hypothetical protein
VFASLHTQPLEAAAIRSLIRTRLALPGAPQMLLQLGPARTTQATARRSPAELIELTDVGDLGPGTNGHQALGRAPGLLVS